VSLGFRTLPHVRSGLIMVLARGAKSNMYLARLVMQRGIASLPSRCGACCAVLPSDVARRENVATAFAPSRWLHTTRAALVSSSIAPSAVVTPRAPEDMTGSSHFLQEAADGERERSQVFHTHIDAPSQACVNALAASLHALRPGTQTRVYPLDSLHLGPQASRFSMFGRTYDALPHFHEIATRDPGLVYRSAAEVRRLRARSGSDQASPVSLDELAEAVDSAHRQTETTTHFSSQDLRQFVSALFRLWDANGSGLLDPAETDESLAAAVHQGSSVKSVEGREWPPGCLPADYALELRCAEAFATVCYGDTFGEEEYATLRSLLEICRDSRMPRVVIELEETLCEYVRVACAVWWRRGSDLGCQRLGRFEIFKDGSPHPLLHRGDSSFTLDLERIGFSSPVEVPAYELHHAIDIPKSLYVV